MPNHLHGIIVQDGAPSTTAQPVLGTIVGAVKSAATRQINARQDMLPLVWQRSYYDHIIRNDRSLERLRRYIAENPERWEIDRLNPRQMQGD